VRTVRSSLEGVLYMTRQAETILMLSDFLEETLEVVIHKHLRDKSQG
jgi:hypothetical protein